MISKDKKISKDMDVDAQDETLQKAAEAPSEEASETVLTNEELAQALEEAQRRADEEHDKYLRLSAEFDNFRKRTMKEKTELIFNGGEKCITSFLPVIDDMERAVKVMETATDIESVRQGIGLIHSKFISTLEQNGVKPIAAIGEPLNTDLHEAIAMVPAANDEQRGRIIDCVQTGYTLNDKVIRFAKVVVGE